MSEREIERIEISLARAKENISNMEVLNELLVDKNFVKLITAGYFRDEASRLVLLKADSSMQTEEHQNAIDKSIAAIGYFRQYLVTIMQLGGMAQKAMEDNEATGDEQELEAGVKMTEITTAEVEEDSGVAGC
jgi:hypothetical protein